MTHYRKVLLTHANLKKPLHLVAGTIAGYHHSDASQATHVYTTGGVFPVNETPEQIDQILGQLDQQPAGKATRRTKK